jgi:hypothetical protein
MTSGAIGALTPSTQASETTKTMTPATAETPASISIDSVTSAASLIPARRAATTRAAGVQTPPGTYFASIETISARSACGYEIEKPQSERIRIQPRTKSR